MAGRRAHTDNSDDIVKISDGHDDKMMVMIMMLMKIVARRSSLRMSSLWLDH